jgi:hypothetical protein
MAQPDVTKQQPIGYWLKHTDEVITEYLDRVLADNGFTRSRWQVLNIVYQESRGGQARNRRSPRRPRALPMTSFSKALAKSADRRCRGLAASTCCASSGFVSRTRSVLCDQPMSCYAYAHYGKVCALLNFFCGVFSEARDALATRPQYN